MDKSIRQKDTFKLGFRSVIFKPVYKDYSNSDHNEKCNQRGYSTKG